MTSLAPGERTYPDIVRGLLAVLTGGVVGEVHEVPSEGLSEVQLLQAPVRRVSWLQGKVEVGTRTIDFRFTERDFELVGKPETPDILSIVRFKPGRKRPAPGTTVTVEYYPLRTRPTQLNDVAVGSVVRTLLETASREIATQYQQLQLVYDSAFLETATGPSLEKVVALLDVRRLERGHPVARVRFQRRQGESDLVTIPVGTVVSDRKGARYLTTDLATLEPGQSSVEVWVHGEATSTPLVDADALTILERAIAGVQTVTNAEPTFRSAEEESDAQLRARARVGLHRAGRGTPAAIRYGLLSLPYVTAVTLVEPPAVPAGTLRVDVALSRDNEVNRAEVRARINELRPAGIYVEASWAAKAVVAVDVGLVLTGASLVSTAVDALNARVRAAVQEHLTALPPGGTLRASRLTALVLGVDERIADASVAIALDGAPVTGNATLSDGRVLDTPTFNFRPVQFTDAAASTTTVTLTAQLQVVLQGGTPLATARTSLRQRLDALLLTLQPGATVDFDRLTTAVRNNSAWVVPAATAIYTFTRPDGTFVEVRSSGGTFVIPSGALLATGELAVEEPS